MDVAAHRIAASPYAYELIYTEEGSIPADLHYVASTDQLARVDSPVHSQLADKMTASLIWFPYQPWQTSSSSQVVPLRGRPGHARHLPDAGDEFGLDVHDPAPGGGRGAGGADPRGRLRLRRRPAQPRAAVAEVTLEVSYDDGGTWQVVRNVKERGDDHYAATLYDRSSDGGFLSVRLSAADEQGNTVEKETIRACALSRR